VAAWPLSGVGHYPRTNSTLTGRKRTCLSPGEGAVASELAQFQREGEGMQQSARLSQRLVLLQGMGYSMIQYSSVTSCLKMFATSFAEIAGKNT